MECRIMNFVNTSDGDYILSGNTRNGAILVWAVRLKGMMIMRSRTAPSWLGLGLGLSGLVLVLGLVLMLHVGVAEAEKAEASVPRVAFVFAGSVRSFVYPPVHLSIKHNLIDGFCPAGSCEAHIFATLSLSDNTHIGAGINAVGKFIPAAKEREVLAHTAMKRLGNGKNLEYEIIDIGSALEKTRMDELSSNNTMHKIYRDLDPRRYNMYYHRWASYQKAVNYEQVNAIKFDWVVHARPDFFFGEPIRSCHNWSPGRLWVPDSWATDVPDTFAVIPRKWSDMYFSLDALYVDRKVGCLGGPNFDPNSVTDEALDKLKYSQQEKEIVRSELCIPKFPDQHLVKSGNVQWSWGGVSEIVLKRKLHLNGIGLGEKTLGFTTVMGIMTRDPVELYCHYTAVGAFISWAKDYYRPTTAYLPLCESTHSEIHRVASADFLSYGENCNNDDPLVSKPADQQSINKPMSTCLLDIAATDWNFLPFRIRGHYNNDCATLDTHNGHDIVSFKKCDDTSKESGYVSEYRMEQLFFLYPLSPIPQSIRTRDSRQCISVGDVAAHAQGGHVFPVFLRPCDADGATKQTDVSQLFRVRLIDYQLALASHLVSPVAGSVAERNLTVHKRKQHLPDLSAVEIRWMGHNEEYCLAHRGSPLLDQQQLELNTKTHLILVHCGSFNPSDQDKKPHLFVLERTVNKSPIWY
jgi:hypothetical protein